LANFSILTPINPHSFSQKPIVIPGDHVVEAQVMTKQNRFGDLEVSLTLDGGQSDHIAFQKNGNIKIQGGEVFIYA
jgi:NAD kinase